MTSRVPTPAWTRCPSSVSESDSAPMAPGAQRPDCARGRASSRTGQRRHRELQSRARLSTGTDAVPAAMYFAGEAARLGGRRDEAIERFGGCATQYPVRHGRLVPCSVGVVTGRRGAAGPGDGAAPAAPAAVSVVARSGDGAGVEHDPVSHCTCARRRNPPTCSVPGVGGPTGKFRARGDIAIDRENNLLVASKTGVTVLSSKGSVAPHDCRSGASRALYRWRRARADAARRGGTPRGREARGRAGHRDRRRQGEAAQSRIWRHDVGRRSARLRSRAQSDRPVLRRRPAEGRVRAPGSGAADGDHGPRRRGGARYGHEDGDADQPGRKNRDPHPGARQRDISSGSRWTSRSTGSVTSTCSTAPAVFVFSQLGPRLVATFTVPEKSPGAFGSPEAMALDSAGRLFVFDSRTDTVQVYR